MDTEFERFRINPETRAHAVEVCARMGYELSDVLRALVTRIAHEDSIPFDLGIQPQAASENLLVGDERLWSPIKSQIEAEIALALLARFIADCSTTIDEQAALDRRDQELVIRLTKEREAARKLRSELDVSDSAAIQSVLTKYGLLVRRPAS
ncbi:Antitoxin DinJ [Planctomycetaceae bacterium]|nr:Antitoxin DinJ [Planctomycetaceae bacterium]